METMMRIVMFVIAMAMPVLVPADELFGPETVQADFDELYATLKAAHYDLHARRNATDYDRRYLETRKAFREPMSLIDIRTQFQLFVAYGNVAHAQIPLPIEAFRNDAANGGRMVPFDIRVVDGRVHVTANNSGVEALKAGSEILAVDGQPAGEWLARLARYVSADHPPLAHGLLEFWLPVVMWLEFGDIERMTLTLASEGGSRQVVVPMVTLEKLRAARAAQPGGLALDFNAREAHLLDNGVAYLRPGPFFNTGGEAMWDVGEFRKFIDAAFTRFIDADVHDLVIDLRNNPGGDKAFSDLMVAWFADRDFQFYSKFRLKASAPTRATLAQALEKYRDIGGGPYVQIAQMAAAIEGRADGERVDLVIDKAKPRPESRFEGRVYVLVNRHTYSNATAVAALVQDYGFATVLGEATHDLPSGYGAAESFTLPRTGIVVHYPKSWFVRPNGDARPHGVVPDHPIRTPVVETSQDIVLDEAVAIVRRMR